MMLFPPTMDIEILTKYSADHVNAAMCMWEHVAFRLRDSTWHDFFESNGTAGVRTALIECAPICETFYLVAAENDALDGVTYDWDFVPWFVDNCLSVSHAAGITCTATTEKILQCRKELT